MNISSCGIHSIIAIYVFALNIYKVFFSYVSLVFRQRKILTYQYGLKCRRSLVRRNLRIKGTTKTIGKAKSVKSNGDEKKNCWHKKIINLLLLIRTQVFFHLEGLWIESSSHSETLDKRTAENTSGFGSRIPRWLWSNTRMVIGISNWRQPNLGNCTSGITVSPKPQRPVIQVSHKRRGGRVRRRRAPRNNGESRDRRSRPGLRYGGYVTSREKVDKGTRGSMEMCYVLSKSDSLVLSGIMGY